MYFLVLITVLIYVYMIIYTKSDIKQEDVERNALKDLYASANGPNWKYKWDPAVLDNGNICDLIGVYCTMSRVTGLNVAENGLIGTVPSSIGNLIQLTGLSLFNNKLSATIPLSICNLTQLTTLQLYNNEFSGNIPLSIGNLIQLNRLSLYNNALTGSIPPSIGNLKQIDQIMLDRNKLSGIIPPSIGNLTKLFYLYLSDNALSGNIPPSIGNLRQLNRVMLYNNKLSGTIPASIGNLKEMIYLCLYDNKLSGTIPASIGNLVQLQALYLHNNKLTGTIPASIGNFNNLMWLDLSHNNLYAQSLTTLLSNLFVNATKLLIFSISNNINIYTDLSELEYLGDITQASMQYFIAQKCSLYGSLPQNIHFTEMRYFMLYNNRLSCDIPSNFINTSWNLTETILPSNLFFIKNDNEIPEWMESSLFRSAASLYVTHFDSIKSMIFVIISAIFVIIIFIKKVIDCYHAKKKKAEETQESRMEILIPHKMRIRKNADSDKIAMNLFFENIVTLKKYFGDIKLILIAMILLIFYYYNSYYFKCSLLSSQLSLSYYYSFDNGMWCDLILIILLGLMYIFMGEALAKSQTDQFNKKRVIYHDDDMNDINSNKISKGFFVIFWFLLYLFLFLLATIFVILSMILDSLPNHNIFKLNSLSIQIAQNSIGVILTINTAIIIPKFVDNAYNTINICTSTSSALFTCKYRPLIIIFLRTVSILIIPLISSVFLLQECGNNWSYFWMECDERHKKQFDIAYWDQLSGDDLTVSSAAEICSSISVYNILWNKCVRTFCAKWSTVITQKQCIMIILPFLMVKWKKIKTMFPKYASKKIKIDMEYSMILTKCESMIIWGVISPFIIPLTIISIYSNHYVYHKMVNKQNWIVEPFDNNVIFPTYILWLSFIFSQCFISIFIFICIHNKICAYLLIIILSLTDAVYIIKHKYCKINTTKQNLALN